jgi:Protein of unknown function (DUF2934)
MTKHKTHPDAGDTSSSLDAPGAHPTREEIAIRAYEIYEAAGRIEGHDGDHWLEAERELKEKYAAQHAKAKSA